MRRREFITLLGSAAAWPLHARAQQTERVQRVGVLMGAPETDHEYQAFLAAFREGLQKLGWAEGRNIRIDYRWGALDTEVTQRFAKELIVLQPDLIFSSSTFTTAALLQQTRTIPHHFREHCRSDRQRLCRESGAARWQRHWLHQSRAEHGRQMARAAQGDCTACHAGRRRVSPGNCPVC
jgi:hypothetical protein